VEAPSIRRATKADALALTRIHVASWRAAYREEISAAFLGSLDVGERVAVTEKRLERPGAVALLTEDARGVLGFCYLGPTRDPDDDAVAVCEIYAIHVHPDHWRHGVGSRLLAAARAEARERGFSSLSLWVLDSNSRARAFYARSGLDPDGAEKMENLGPGVRIREVRYRGPLGADA
jgi:GNAT superfamily N-acetyltransferase